MQVIKTIGMIFGCLVLIDAAILGILWKRYGKGDGEDDRM